MNKKNMVSATNNGATTRSKYKLVSPRDYTEEHISYINEYKKSIQLLASQSHLMLITLDTECRFITGTDLSAKKFGFKSGDDFTGKQWGNVPCESVAACGEELNRQAMDIMNSYNINTAIETLNVFEFTDGLKARVGSNTLFYHAKSRSILGKTGIAHDVELKDFINIIPSYILRFGALGTIENIDQRSVIANEVMLSDYEQEICFLFLLGWNFSQVADFMNVYRPPNDNPRNGDTIIKKKNYICQKLKLTTTHVKDLCEYLFSIGFHKKMPHSFYSNIIGTKVINQ